MDFDSLVHVGLIFLRRRNGVFGGSKKWLSVLHRLAWLRLDLRGVCLGRTFFLPFREPSRR